MHLGLTRSGYKSVTVEVVYTIVSIAAQWITEGVTWPRNFAISTDGEWLLVANQKANSITTYSLNDTSGKPVDKIDVSSPVCIKF